LEDEAAAIARAYPQAPALSGIGYQEALAIYRGSATAPEALRATIRRTSRYAKRQRTWFAHMDGATFVPADSQNEAAVVVERLARETFVLT